MAIMFPTLGKTTVNIGIADGRYVTVAMLPVSDYDKFRELQKDIADMPEQEDTDEQRLERIKKIEAGRAAMLAMAGKVMPAELMDNVARLNYMQLTSLVMVLCTGEDDSDNDDPKKKITYPSQLTKNITEK